MVHQKYLDQALRIRKDFISTDDELLNLKNDLERINNNIQTTLAKLIKISENTKKYKTNEEFQNDVIENLQDFEIQAESVNKLYTPLNDRMEKLKTEEEGLYNKLIEKYSHLKQEVIIQEIQEYVRQKLKL